MNLPIPFTISNSKITLHIEGEDFRYSKREPHFRRMQEALLESRWDEARHLLFMGPPDSLRLVAGAPLEAAKLVYEMEDQGKDPTCIRRFLNSLSENPSYHVGNFLWGYLQANSELVLLKDGSILAYKVSEEPPELPEDVIAVERRLVSDRPAPSDTGFQVGPLTWAAEALRRGRGSGRGRSTILRCKVYAKNVVYFNKADLKGTMRVCRYEVLDRDAQRGIYQDPLFSVGTARFFFPKPPRKDAPREEPILYLGAARKPVSDAAGSFAKKLAPLRGTVGGRDSSAGWEGFHQITNAEIPTKSVADLRKYATHALKIKNSGKLRKVDLVDAILARRR
jgi:hypothetical protein